MNINKEDRIKTALEQGETYETISRREHVSNRKIAQIARFITSRQTRRTLGKGKVNLGPIGFEWETAMKDPNANLDFIKKQIDSFIIIIERSNEIHPDDVLKQARVFLAIMLQYGHISRLDQVYQDKYFKITSWVKNQLDRLKSSI